MKIGLYIILISCMFVIGFKIFFFKKIDNLFIENKIKGTYIGNKCTNNSYQLLKIQKNNLFIFIQDNKKDLKGKLKISNDFISDKIYFVFDLYKNQEILTGSILTDGTILQIGENSSSQLIIKNMCGSYSKQPRPKK